MLLRFLVGALQPLVFLALFAERVRPEVRPLPDGEAQELDAMQVMGISHGQRLILPRVIALAIAMPLLVLWTDAVALLGGMLAAKWQLGLSIQWFFSELPDAVGLTNYKISLIKGVTFGAWIALIACHFGLRIEPNTESLGRGTTASVVTAITGVILIDALYAILFNEMGI